MGESRSSRNNMKRFLFFAAAFAAAQLAAAAPLATGERLISPNGAEAVRAYRDVEFLNLVPNGRDSLWRVQSGVLQTSNDQGASWASAPTGLVARPLVGDWEGIQIAGAPAVAKEPFAIEYSLGPEFQFKAISLIGDTVLEFGREQKQVRPGYSVPEVSVVERALSSSEGAPVSSFRINEENFQYRLASALPLSDTLIAILAGSDHPYVNSIVFFDRATNQPVGYLPYGEINYLPSEKAFRVVEPLPRAQDTPEALEEARRQARTVPIWIDGKLNAELAETDLFSPALRESAVIQGQESPTPDARVNTSPPMEGAPTASPSLAQAEQSQGINWMWLTAGAVLLMIAGWALSKRSG